MVVSRLGFCADSESINSRISISTQTQVIAKDKSTSWIADKKKCGLCQMVFNFTKLSRKKSFC